MISIFAGPLGIDRLYQGENALGILKLLTFGGFGVWAIVDTIIWAKSLGKVVRSR